MDSANNWGELSLVLDALSILKWLKKKNSWLAANTHLSRENFLFDNPWVELLGHVEREVWWCLGWNIRKDFRDTQILTVPYWLYFYVLS